MASTAQSRIKSISYAKYGYMFIAPFFIIYAFFQVWPLINTFILSLYGNGAEGDVFVGLQNFQDILFGGDSRSVRKIHEDFFRDFGNTIVLWVGNFILQIFLSLLLAVWFTDSKLHIPGQGFFKVVMYLPNIITAVSVAALFMRFFSNSQMSVANSLLGADNMIMFEDSPVWSRAIVMVIQTWMWFGNTMIMMMSGILGINPSLFEAAAIDGASSGQVLRKITMPLLRPMVVYTLITSMIGGLQMFDIPYLYHTRPSTINPYLETVAVFVYTKFRVTSDRIQYGYAGAASILLFIVTAALGLIVFRMNRDEDEHRKKKERKELVKAYKKEQKLQKMGGVN